MTFYEKIKAFLGLGGVILADATGAAITAEKEAELANSLEFSALLEGELKGIAVEQAGIIASQKTELAANAAQVSALAVTVKELAAQVAAQGEVLNAVAQTTKEAQAAAAKAESRVGEVAAVVNNKLGLPLVKPTEEDGRNELAGGKQTVQEIKTIDAYLKAVKGK